MIRYVPESCANIEEKKLTMQIYTMYAGSALAHVRLKYFKYDFPILGRKQSRYQACTLFWHIQYISAGN